MKRSFPLSEEVLAVSRRFLESRSLSYENAQDRKKIAASILRLSDFFIENPTGATPWDEPWAQEAYFAYYLPLNEVRTRAVVEEGLKAGFFDGLSKVVDFGAGPGTADYSLRAKVPALSSYTLVERSSVPARILPEWKYQTQLPASGIDSKTLFVASYSLTEAEIPAPAFQAEALMILEPSTQQDGRELLELRQRLIDRGYSMWAPCTHQSSCPLLTKSPRDWCHDRVHVERPLWWSQLEEQLPFRNQTVTFSYLLARKTEAPLRPPNEARVIGDSLPEKGKTRQMICRGPDREFVAWLHRGGTPPEWPRGIVVDLPEDAKKVSNELRLKA